MVATWLMVTGISQPRSGGPLPWALESSAGRTAPDGCSNVSLSRLSAGLGMNLAGLCHQGS